jgi:heterodisulfide reductase subunit A
MVKLTIDGKVAEVEEGQTLLQAATGLGIQIPTLCNHEAIAPYGACRMCIVEVTRDERTRVVVSCVYLVEDGIKVITNSKRIQRSRQVILELLLARCPESKELKEFAERLGVRETRFRVEHETQRKRKNCILCGLCVRVCHEVMKVGAIGFRGRGWRREVDTPFGTRSDVCIGCGACEVVCPTRAVELERVCEEEIRKIPSEYDLGLGSRAANYLTFPNALPKVPVIDKDTCVYQTRGRSEGEDICKACERVCQAGAIQHAQTEERVKFQVGAILIATGFKEYDPSVKQNLGFRRYPNVITQLQLARMIDPNGPTEGKVLRPSDSKAPHEIVMVQCVGSRDDQSTGHPYCSRVCCMFAVKNANLIKHGIIDDARITICYMDIRAFGKGYEEYYKRAQSAGIRLLRGRVAEIRQERNNDLVVRVEDTLAQKVVELPADLVVLAAATEPAEGIQDLARILGIELDEHGFVKERGPKLRPCDTSRDGIFVCGSAQAPQDIPDGVAQASGAAGRIERLLSQDLIEVSYE